MTALNEEIATVAARIAVEEGLEFGLAKRRAVRQMGLPPRTPLPDSRAVDDKVREYIALYCADTQPAELLALRRLAMAWMERLARFRPHVTGAVWEGTATRLSDITLQLFCDDSKAAEIELIDQAVSFEPRTANGFRGNTVEVLSVHAWCAGLQETIGLHLVVYDHDDLRGALHPDASGRRPRGDLAALQRLVHDASP